MLTQTDYTLRWNGSTATLYEVRWDFSTGTSYGTQPPQLVPTPTWSSYTQIVTATLWMKNVVSQSLPALNEAELKTSTYTSYFFAFSPKNPYCGSVTCLINGNRAATSGDIFVNAANLDAVTINVAAGITDRTKIGTWTIVQ